MATLVSLTRFAAGLMADVRDHRAGKLTTRDARARAMLAREALRAVSIELEGRKFLEASADTVSGSVRLLAGRRKNGKGST